MRNGYDISVFINNPRLIDELELGQIEDWIEETPYAQYLHLLKALKLKSLEKTDPSLYHKTATVVTDRINLHALLEPETQKIDLEEESTTPEDELKSNTKKSITKTQARKKKKELGKEVGKAFPDDDESNSSKDLVGIKQVESSDWIETNNDHDSISIEKIELNRSISKIEEFQQEAELEEEEEESIEDWNDYLKIDRAAAAELSELKLKEDLKENESLTKSETESGGTFTNEPALSDYSSTTELSEFSEWLLALSDKNDVVDEQRVEESVTIKGAAISETLAQILIAQGHKDEAIEMYEKLRLINPEKSAYFAALIQKNI